ncbi:MAG: hypothetical protein PHE83_03305 [Opitutaceae bacterium]|nr:hypothetical protein [Opitutaceae bacterium]
MNWRRLLPWLIGLAVFAALLAWRLHDRRRHAGPVDLTRHDGQTIDFSSGRPVVKDTPGDRAATEKAVQEMEEAVKDITFNPSPPKAAEQKPAEPPKN